jgi:Mlc titration factor MtfA (ptsG expression regulator)
MISPLKRRRRAALRAREFPDAWVSILRANVPAYRRLPANLCAQLHGHIHVFLAEKRFEGCNGQEIDDEVRVTIAGQACLLILERPTDYYPDLVTILVYPSVFYAGVEEHDGHVVSEFVEDRTGESWELGVVILSWEDAVKFASTGRAGYNVVLHEFAHQLDNENGEMDGMPKLPDRKRRESWARVFRAAYDHFERAAASRRRTLIDTYGAGDPAEFFAVVTESFFERPAALRREYAELYDELARYYHVDPAAWQANEASITTGAVAVSTPRGARRRPRRRR